MYFHSRNDTASVVHRYYLLNDPSTGPETASERLLPGNRGGRRIPFATKDGDWRCVVRQTKTDQPRTTYSEFYFLYFYFLFSDFF